MVQKESIEETAQSRWIFEVNELLQRRLRLMYVTLTLTKYLSLLLNKCFYFTRYVLHHHLVALLVLQSLTHRHQVALLVLPVLVRDSRSYQT
jgi:hypothetical protein